MVGFHLVPILAITQTAAKPSMRALASAIVLLTATSFDQAVGPLVVGILNDALKTTLAMTPCAICCCGPRSRPRSARCYLSGRRRFIRKDIERMRLIGQASVL